MPPRADGKPPDLAFGAYQRGNFLFALREAERRLDDNPKDAAAMTLIGVIYHDGAAVGRNDLEASRWYRLASNLGDPQAAYELGALLLEGGERRAEGPRRAPRSSSSAPRPRTIRPRSTISASWRSTRATAATPDFAAAAQYFLAAANAGDDNGAYSYGVMLREGKGVPQNVAEGAHWLKRAADGGVIAGQVEYAIMLFNGEGVPKDEAGAVKILQDRRGQGQPDRPEPPRPSLRRRPRGRARSRQGRGLERLRQGGRPAGSGPRRRDRQSDAGRAQPLHQDRSRDQIGY